MHRFCAHYLRGAPWVQLCDGRLGRKRGALLGCRAANRTTPTSIPISSITAAPTLERWKGLDPVNKLSIAGQGVVRTPRRPKQGRTRPYVEATAGQVHPDCIPSGATVAVCGRRRVDDIAGVDGHPRQDAPSGRARFDQPGERRKSSGSRIFIAAGLDRPHSRPVHNEGHRDRRLVRDAQRKRRRGRGGRRWLRRWWRGNPAACDDRRHRQERNGSSRASEQVHESRPFGEHTVLLLRRSRSSLRSMKDQVPFVN